MTFSLLLMNTFLSKSEEFQKNLFKCHNVHLILQDSIFKLSFDNLLCEIKMEVKHEGFKAANVQLMAAYTVIGPSPS